MVDRNKLNEYILSPMPNMPAAAKAIATSLCNLLVGTKIRLTRIDLHNFFEYIIAQQKFEIEINTQINDLEKEQKRMRLKI